jgi:pantetheine-phosphate adenylyltransferase
MRRAVCPGSFDPPTFGHLDVIHRAAELFDQVTVAVLVNDSKVGLFSVEERLAMIREAAGDLLAREGCALEAVAFSGLAIEAARAAGARIIVRGLRESTDFDYEMQMAGMNAAMAPDIQTIFIPAAVGSRHITATLVRQIAAMGGDVTPFVPAAVASALAAKRAAAR